MKRTIYDCWRCRHHNSDNPYGIDYCEVHDTRCSFAHDDCDNFEPINDGNVRRSKPTDGGSERRTEPPRRLSVIIWYLEIIAVAAILGWLLMGCTTTKYVTVPEVHEHWHHSTDTIHQTDSIIDHQTTTIREVDSATMAQYGIQMKNMQRAWIIETNRLQRELSELRQTRADTIHERDSIPYPVEVVREVPRKRSTMEWGLLTIGAIALIGGIVWISVRIKR